MNNYNAEQQTFIDCPAKQIVVSASPGSGKSHALIGRIAADQQRGVAAESQVVITYTVAAAENLTSRITGSKPGFVGTIHALCLKWIRQYGKPLGYTPDAQVMDEDESKALLASIAKSIGFKGNPDHERGNDESRTVAQIAAKQHLRELRKRNLVDFVTMQREVLRLIEEGYIPPVGATYCDESQDVSELESQIIAALTSEIKILVGDDDQSIFLWRGASPRVMYTTLPNATYLTLSTNHRSDTEIITAANRIIRHFGYPRHNRLNIALPSAEAGRVDIETHADEQVRDRACVGLANSIFKSGQTVAILCRYNVTANRLKAMVPPSLKDFSVSQIIGSQLLDQRIAKSALRVLAGARDTSEPYWQVNRLVDHLCELPLAVAIRHMGLTKPQIRIIELALNAAGADLGLAALAIGDGEQADDDFHIGTIHSSKGKEYSAVIVCGCEDANWELKRADDDELRRLFYVASTRAKHRLVYSCAESVFLDGIEKKAKPSKFLIEATTPTP